MEYYSSIKKNEIMSFAGKWKELETMLRKGASLRNIKISCSLSYAESRPKN
jgi:hypothetical protein